MKTLVCFKVVPDLDQITSSDYDIKDRINVDTSFVKKIWNCFDESGLEFGLRLSDESESLNFNMEKTALTVGNSQLELYLKTLNALKYNQTVLVDSADIDLRFKPDLVATAIKEYVIEYPQNLIIMGNQAPEGNHFSVPFLVATQLGIPCIPNVIDIHFINNECIRVRVEREGNIYEQIVSFPVILTIGNAVISKLRVPTLKDRMNYGNREIIKRGMNNEYSSLLMEVHALEKIDRSRKGDIIEAQGKEAIKLLFENQLSNKNYTI